MILLLLLSCDRELATLKEPEATWTHVKDFDGGGRGGGIAE